MKRNLESKKIKEFLERGVEQIINKDNLIKKLTSARKLKIKFGVDPTSSTLHLGNAIPLWKIRQFQKMGHKAIVIIGDFTARIGDPSDKTSIRQPLHKKQVMENMKNYKNQMGKILDLKRTQFLYNSSWLNKLNFEEILKLAGQFTVAQMLERRNFNERYKNNKPINLQEFLYPLMQGYDSVAIQSDIELGGTDQTFNLLAGRVIQSIYKQELQDIMTLTLIEGTDGRKMSKSFGNIIAITDKPRDMFGKVMSIGDDLIIKYFTMCTLIPLKEVKKIEKELNLRKINPRDAKIRLAKEIVAIYHGKKTAIEAEREFNKIFKEKGVPSKIIKVKIREGSLNILELLVKTKLVYSKSEAKRLISQKAIKINEMVQNDWKKDVEVKKGMIVRVGKRKFIRIA